MNQICNVALFKKLQSMRWLITAVNWHINLILVWYIQLLLGLWRFLRNFCVHNSCRRTHWTFILICISDIWKYIHYLFLGVIRTKRGFLIFWLCGTIITTTDTFTNRAVSHLIALWLVWLKAILSFIILVRNSNKFFNY